MMQNNGSFKTTWKIAVAGVNYFIEYFWKILIIINIILMMIFWARSFVPIAEYESFFTNGSDFIALFLSAQANQYSLLQIYLIFFSLILAAAAIWGYNQIKKDATDRAEKIARKTAQECVKKYLKESGAEVIAKKLAVENMNPTPQQRTHDESSEEIKPFSAMRSENE
jgi:hypothetical protein